MKTIQKYYLNIRNKNKSLSDYLCFAEAIENRKFSRFSILENFNKLVDKSEYENKDKTRLINNLYILSNPPVEQRLEVKNASGDTHLYEDDTSY